MHLGRAHVESKIQEAKSSDLSADAGPCGRFLPDGFGCPTFSPTSKEDGTFSNEIAPLSGIAQFCLTGSYTLRGRIMTLEFEELQVKILWTFTLPILDIREGQGVRQWREKLVRGGKKNTKTFEKRPNICSWLNVDENMCVAQGSSGFVDL